jgi:hypothetical protein
MFLPKILANFQKRKESKGKFWGPNPAPDPLPSSLFVSLFVHHLWGPAPKVASYRGVFTSENVPGTGTRVEYYRG